MIDRVGPSTLVLALLWGSGCDNQTDHVQVSLTIERKGCVQSTCVESLSGSGYIYQTAEKGSFEAGPRTLYSEIYTSSGTLSLLEIGIDERGRRKVRYREISDGKVVFRGRIVNAHVEIPQVGSWAFRFEAYDANDPNADRPARIITSGSVAGRDGQLRAVQVGTRQTPEGYREPRVVIYVDQDYGCGGSDDYLPTDPSDPRFPGNVEPATDIEVPPEVPEGPDGPGVPPGTPTPGFPEPPESPESPDWSSDGGGCEGDDYDDSSGCDGDSGDSGGCEGDSMSSSGGCDDDSSMGSGCDSGDGCEGDTTMHSSLSAKRRMRRGLRSMARLGWPLILAGYFNRRRKYRA